MDARGLRVGGGMEWMESTAVVHRGGMETVEPWLEGTGRLTF